MKKIALVNQRYGLEVNGGSELLCRQLAEKLTSYYDVEVLTTCAMDYVTWDNHYEEGLEVINGVKVRRFNTEKSRNTSSFNNLSENIFNAKQHSDEEELNWINEQGPYCPAFLEYIKENAKKYDAIIYTTYLYYLTARGILDTPNDNIFLLPTAHDEPPIYLKHYEKVFEAPKAFIFITEEEKVVVNKIFPHIKKPSITINIGIDVPTGIPESSKIRQLLGFSEKYIVYVGRVEESKGCGLLFNYFNQYKNETKSDVKLVLVGKHIMDVPENPDIVSLGFVDEAIKFAVIAESHALVLASEFESLSMVLLESMIMGRPVLVNGKCEVLKRHCEKSNGGLHFTSYHHFKENLYTLINDTVKYTEMQKNAKKYIEKNYSWTTTINEIKKLLGKGDTAMVEIDIKKIMEDIKKEISTKNLNNEYPDFNQIKATLFDIKTFNEHINNANLCWNIQGYRSLTTTLGILGKIKIFCKKAIRKLCNFYIEPIVAEQREFNSNTINALNQIKAYITDQELKEDSKK